MKLTIMERINLRNILPKEGNFLELSIIRELQDELQFSKEEIQKAAIEDLPGNQIKWSKDAAETIVKNCNIPKLAEGIIIEELKNLDKQKKLQIFLLSLYEKFVISKEESPTAEEKEK